MATQADTKDLDLQAQLAKIRRDIAEINQREIQINQTRQDMFWKPWQIVLTSILGSAGLLGAGIAIGGIAVKLLGG